MPDQIDVEARPQVIRWPQSDSKNIWGVEFRPGGGILPVEQFGDDEEAAIAWAKSTEAEGVVIVGGKETVRFWCGGER